MKKLSLSLLGLLCFLITLKGQEVSREYSRNSSVYPSVNEQLKHKARPYFNQPALRAGGGGVSATDCYQFVPVPEDAILLDFNSNNCSGSGGLDAAHGPFDLGFEFCHFGELYDEVTISNKGNIQFNSCDFVFEPSGFPNPNLPIIAAFWADVDMSCPDCGDLYYWFTPTAAYFTWVEVGYWPGVSSLKNTFQIVITDGTDPIVGLGNNVGLFYQDMQWASSNWNGGVGGFNGDAATVGANQGPGGNSYIQFGRFLFNNDDYDGPFGTDDGVHWLDDKAFVFNICSNEDNLPPVSGVSDVCDTIFICQNDTYEIDLSFFGPEPDQTVTITVEDSSGGSFVINENNNGTLNGFFEGNSDNIGQHTLIITATDDGTPQGVTVVTYDIVVQDIVLPDLEVVGENFMDNIGSYCAGLGGVELTASDGFDSYFWSSDDVGQNATITAGTHSVIGVLGGCQQEFGPFDVFEIPSFNPEVTGDFFGCAGDTLELSVVNPDQYQTISWSVFNNSGQIFSEDTEQSTIEASTGFYQVSVTDDTECPGVTTVPISEEVVNIPPTTFQALCNDDDEISWSGAWAEPNACNYGIWMFDNEGDTWEGANISVFVDGTGPFNYNIANGSGFDTDIIQVFHGQVIEYFWTPGLDDDDITVQLLDENNQPVFDTEEGDLLTSDGVPFFVQIANCGFNALPGTWTVDVPEGGEGFVMDCLEEGIFNPVNGSCTFTAPLGFNGVYGLEFDSDVCNQVIEFDLVFWETPTVEAFDYLDICEGTGVTLEPEFGPSNDIIENSNITWSPVSLGNGETAFTDGAINYTVTIAHPNGWCGSATSSGEVTAVPQPTAVLANETSCDPSVVLDPTSPDHPSFVYEWSTGADTETIEVFDTGLNTPVTYSVIVSNECGEASTSADINFGRFAEVFYAPDSLLYCAGEVQNIAPIWNNGEGISTPVLWTLSYTNEFGEFVSETFDNTSPAIDVSADQIPTASIDDSAILTFFTNEVCADAQGSVVLQLIPCEITAPNVITPDNDGGESFLNDPDNPGSAFNGGLNEAWFLGGIGRLTGIKVNIFDRWGNLVYENNNYSNDDPWTGEDMNGNELKEGVYFYTIEAGDNIDPMNGTVNIFRK